MAKTSKAAVLLGPRRMEFREFPLPEVGEDDGLLRVEACGVCGADWAVYIGEGPEQVKPPLILGHEIVGRVERLGAKASQRYKVREGDRVVVEEPLPCGACEFCLSGQYWRCTASNVAFAERYGGRPLSEPPSLWGGYSEYLYLDPRTLMHKMSSDVPIEIAPLFIPISNGIHWVQTLGGAGIGSIVVILGPGQQGLGCVIAAREAGAECIIITGLSRDRGRLALAKELGADHTICVDEEDAVDRAKEITGGRFADTVVNVTAGAPEALAVALDLAGIGATIVNAGSAHGPVPNFMPDKIGRKLLTIKGAGGRPQRATKAAVHLIESGKYPLEKISTHTFPLEEAERAIKTVGREGEPGAVHVSVVSRGP